MARKDDYLRRRPDPVPDSTIGAESSLGRGAEPHGRYHGVDATPSTAAVDRIAQLGGTNIKPRSASTLTPAHSQDPGTSSPGDDRPQRPPVDVAECHRPVVALQHQRV